MPVEGAIGPDRRRRRGGLRAIRARSPGVAGPALSPRSATRIFTSARWAPGGNTSFVAGQGRDRIRITRYAMSTIHFLRFRQRFFLDWGLSFTRV